mmetsp:Transcript_16186/g.27888  ORF Transcript_16186/g.27888 Transcript_16186/m.27888 type:complete len:83 (-) Transcript_16186:142-390(-)
MRLAVLSLEDTGKLIALNIISQRVILDKKSQLFTYAHLTNYLYKQKKGTVHLKTFIFLWFSNYNDGDNVPHSKNHFTQDAHF